MAVTVASDWSTRGATARPSRRLRADLAARVVRHANALRGGWACGSEFAKADRRWLDFLYEVGEIAARGGDVHSRVVGAWAGSDEAAA